MVVPWHVLAADCCCDVDVAAAGLQCPDVKAHQLVANDWLSSDIEALSVVAMKFHGNDIVVVNVRTVGVAVAADADADVAEVDDAAVAAFGDAADAADD